MGAVCGANSEAYRDCKTVQRLQTYGEHSGFPGTVSRPRVEDLFTALSGGKQFSKLDMILDEESKKYVTVNTHRGIFKYNRLPFGVASAPDIFRRTMEGLLKGIPFGGCVFR